MVLSVATLAVGCEKEQTSSPPLERVRTETREAAQEVKEYTYAQKAEYTTRMESQLAEINRDLDQLAAKIERSSDKAKADANPKLQALRDQAAGLNKQLDQVRNATESTWDSVKSGTRDAFEAMKEGFHQSRQWLSDKIAP